MEKIKQINGGYFAIGITSNSKLSEKKFIDHLGHEFDDLINEDKNNDSKYDKTYYFTEQYSVKIYFINNYIILCSVEFCDFEEDIIDSIIMKNISKLAEKQDYYSMHVAKIENCTTLALSYLDAFTKQLTTDSYSLPEYKNIIIKFFYEVTENDLDFEPTLLEGSFQFNIVLLECS